MKTILKYKTNEGKIVEEVVNKTEALFKAHSNVHFNKVWKGSVVFALDKKGKKDGIYGEFGEDILRK
jgi:penicillin-binding protein-related factor A (putative recombinase)